MEQTVLTTGQKRVIDLFRKTVKLSSLFYLSGGTALAEFYLRHRYSEDLDFFTAVVDFPSQLVEEFIQKISEDLRAETRFQKLHDRRMFFLKLRNDAPELKIEFTFYPFHQLEATSDFEGLTVDSLLDIAVNKLMAMIERFEPKDFVDLFFILKHYFKLEQLTEGVSKKFGFKLTPITLGSELAKVRQIKILPKLIKQVSVEELKEFFSTLAKDLLPKVIE